MNLGNFLNKIFNNKNKKKIYSMENLDISERENAIKNMTVSASLENNLETIKELYGNSIDLNIRRFKVGANELPAALVYLSGLSSAGNIEELLKIVEVELLKIEELSGNKLYSTIKTRLLNNKKIQISNKFTEILSATTRGLSALLFDGISEVIICETEGFQIRSIEEPDNEIVIRGPRDGFVENIFTNTSLIRQRINVPHLWFEKMEIGSLSKTRVALGYIKGLASEELIAEVKSRLKKIDIDNVPESGIIQEYIHDSYLTVFPLIGRTERPDRVVSCLVEGKVCILTDNTPFVLLLPVYFSFFLQAPDDYYETFPIGSFVRVLRYISFAISLFLPGIYVAVINFHPELLPIDLLLRIAATREGVPFPVIIEALLMEGLFEVLREAGVRLPRAIGSAISIVGALILGDAAIQAGLASPPMIIIVALTAIASFTTPSITLGIAARILRFFFLLLGATIGLFGIQFGILLLLIHLSSLRSFGQPYFQPFAPFIWQDMKDSILRLPVWKFIKRPALLTGQEPQRQKKGQKPRKPDKKKDED